MRRLIICAAVLLCGVGEVEGTIVTWNFAGTMDSGDPFSGFVSYDSVAADVFPGNPLRSTYNFAVTDLRVDIAGAEVSYRSPNSSEIDILMDESFPNPVGHSIHFKTDAFSSDIANLTEVRLSFVDASGSLLSDTQLLTVPPDLSSLMLDPILYDKGDWLGIPHAATLELVQYSPQLGRLRQFGEITALSSIPEPSTFIIWSLLGALGITVGWWRRRK